MLTVNGKVEIVVIKIQAFQEIMNRLEQVEEELRVLKLEALRHEIDIGIEQFKNGQYTEYDEESLSSFFEDIKLRGRKRLAQREAS